LAAPHVLFVHKNFPAQFGHIAAQLVARYGWKCTFISEKPGSRSAGIYRIQYRVGGAASDNSHYAAQTFENGIWHAAGVYDRLKPMAQRLRPDLVVAHSGFGSSLFLEELFPGIPVIGYFEYFYHAASGDIGFRPDYPVGEHARLRSRARNAMILLDLEYAAAGYSPTHYQRDLMPSAYRDNIRVIHDGVPTEFWRPRARAPIELDGMVIDPERPVVTYVSRGFESMRGFDVFMEIAAGITDQNPDALVLAIGSDKVFYGGDMSRIEEESFKAHVLGKRAFNLDRIRFPGRIPPDLLARVLARSDLHIYLTVPFVLSWSILDAMSCGCTVLASDTAPVREILRHGENGLLCDFFDVPGFTQIALEVLKKPREARRQYGRAARETIETAYGIEVTLPEMESFYRGVAGV
jgi:glycosyltransferase involved in cell wall biosynthesis